MSSSRIRSERGERKGGIYLPVLIISMLSLFFGALAFILRLDSVGMLVSFADATLLASAFPLFISAMLFVYRRGGLDIFIYPLSRLFASRGCMPSGYLDFTKRERRGAGLALPLLAVGGILFALSIFLALL